MAYITLNKKYFFNNLDIITQLTCDKDKIALVLKDNAYGHGLLEVAQMAQEYGIRKAVVRSVSEAEQVEKYFEYILVLADTPAQKSEKIRFTINDLSQIEYFAVGTKVELKVDSAMNRNGIEADELARAFEKIQARGLVLEAVFTHHSSADEENGFYLLQKENFAQIKKEAQRLAKMYGFAPLRLHSCNSAALFKETAFDEDMVRVGIAAYGCLELPFEGLHNKLQPILQLFIEKISQRTLQKGECVGYGATFQTQQVCEVSNYDFGYADGFLRSCSNHYVTPNGEKIAGRISMDNSSFLTDKEQLLLFDDARVAAKQAGTISYEMLTSLRSYIKRSIVTTD